MSSVVFEIKRSYSQNGEVKIGILSFGPRSYGDRGLDILAVKVALGQVVTLEQETVPTTNFEQGLWADAISSNQIGINDGSLFDRKLEVALTDYQIQNSALIKSYYSSRLIHFSHGSPRELFNSELGTIGPATLSILHGWRDESGVLFDMSFQSDEGEVGIESILSRAAQTVLSNSQSNNFENQDDNKRRETVIRAFQPDHLSHSGPFTVDINTIGFYYNTSYTYENPPVFDDPVLAAAIEREMMDKGLLSYIKHENKPDIWILPQNLFTEAAYRSPTLESSHDGTRADVNEVVLSTVQNMPDSQHYSIFDSQLDESPLVRFVEFRSPSPRPGDTYRAVIYINKKKANLIINGHKTYQVQSRANAFIPLPASLDESIERQRDSIESFKASKAMSTLGLSEEGTERKLQEFRSYAAKRKIDIARQLRRAAGDNKGVSIDIDLGPLGVHKVQKKSDYMTLADAVSAASSIATAIGEISDELKDNSEQMENLTLTIERNDLQSKIIQASENLRKFAPDLKGEDIQPKIDLEEEANSLGEVYLALDEFIKVDSKYSSFITETAPDPADNYRPSIDAISIPGEIFFTFKFAKVQKIPGRIEGLRIESISIEKSNGTMLVYSSSQTEYARFFQDNAPLNRPRTMGYFWQIDKISVDSGFSLTDLLACEDIFGKPMKPGVQYALKYTFPTLKLQSRKTFPSQIKEFTREVESTVDEWWESTKDNLESGLPETFSIAPTLPDFSKVCGLDKIYSELLDVTDIKSILCDFLRCFKLPSFDFNLNLDLQLPEIPILPTFDFLAIFIKMLIQAFVDMLVAMLCAIVQLILDALKAPNCDAIFNNDLKDKVEMDDELAQKALGDFFTDTGIDQNLLDDAKSLLNDLFKILDPRDICALLNGNANQQVLTMVSNYVSSAHESLKDFFSDKENIVYFFTSVGAYVDPSFCEEIERLSNLDVRSNRSDSYLEDCTPSELLLGQIRERLVKGGASSTDVEKALNMKKDEMARHSEALAKALNGEEIAKILPSVIDPNEPGSLIGDTPVHMKNMTDHVISGVFSAARNTYIQEINAFVTNLSESLKMLPKPGDDSYDPVANIEFDTAAERLQLYKDYGSFAANYNQEVENEVRQRRASLSTTQENIDQDQFDLGGGVGAVNFGLIGAEIVFTGADGLDPLLVEFLMIDEDGRFCIPPEKNVNLVDEMPKFTFDYWKSRVYRHGVSESPQQNSDPMTYLSNLKEPVALYKLTSDDISIINEGFREWSPSRPTETFFPGTHPELEQNGSVFRGYLLSAGFISLQHFNHIFFPDDYVNNEEWIGRPLINYNAYHKLRVTGRATDNGAVYSDRLADPQSVINHIVSVIENMMPKTLNIQTISSIFPLRFMSRTEYSRSLISEAYYANGDPGTSDKHRINFLIGENENDRLATMFYNDDSNFADDPASTRRAFSTFTVSDRSTNIFKEFTYCRAIPDALLRFVSEEAPQYPVGGNSSILKRSMFLNFYVNTAAYYLSLSHLQPPNLNETLDSLRALHEGLDAPIHIGGEGDNIYDSTFSFIVQKMLEIIEDSNGLFHGVPKTLQNSNYLSSLENRLMGKSFMDPIDGCMVDPPTNMHSDTVLSFDNWTKNASTLMQKEIKKRENSPLNVDFTGSFPADKGLALAAAEIFFKVICTEILLKGLAYNSNMSASTYLSSKFFMDYMEQYVIIYLKQLSMFVDNREVFERTFSKLANIDLPMGDDSLSSSVRILLNKYAGDVFTHESDTFRSENSSLIDALFDKIISDSRFNRGAISLEGDFVVDGTNAGVFTTLAPEKVTQTTGPDAGKPVSRFIIEYYIRIVFGDLLEENAGIKKNAVYRPEEAVDTLNRYLDLGGDRNLNDVDVRYGVRLVHVQVHSPQDLDSLDQQLLHSVASAGDARNDIVERTFRSGTVLNMDDTGNTSYPVVCIPMSSTERSIHCAEPDSIIQDFTNDMKKSLLESLKSNPMVKDHLFGFFFPLEDIAAITAVYAISYASSNKFVNNLFSPTKTMLLNTILIANSRRSFARQSDPLATAGIAGLDELKTKMETNTSSDGPLFSCLQLPSFMPNTIDLAAAFERLLEMLFKQFPSVLLRGLANELDPAYNEMRKHHMNCRPVDTHLEKLDLGSLRADSLKGLTHVNLAEGVDKRGDCENPGKYVSVLTGFPLEISKAVGIALVNPYAAAELMGGSLMKLTNYISSLPTFMIQGNYSILCQDGNFGFTDRDLNNGFLPGGRYGHPITPFGLLALSTHELTGEKIINNCEPFNECGDPGPPPPPGAPQTDCDSVSNPLRGFGPRVVFEPDEDSGFVEDDVVQGFATPDPSVAAAAANFIDQLPEEGSATDWSLLNIDMLTALSVCISTAYPRILNQVRAQTIESFEDLLAENGGEPRNGEEAIRIASALRVRHPLAFRRHVYIDGPPPGFTRWSNLVDEPAVPADYIMWYGFAGSATGVSFQVGANGPGTGQPGILSHIVGFGDTPGIIEEIIRPNRVVYNLSHVQIDFLKSFLSLQTAEGPGPKLPDTAALQREIFGGVGIVQVIDGTRQRIIENVLGQRITIQTHWSWEDIRTQNIDQLVTPVKMIGQPGFTDDNSEWNADRNVLWTNNRDDARAWMAVNRGIDLNNGSSIPGFNDWFPGWALMFQGRFGWF